MIQNQMKKKRRRVAFVMIIALFVCCASVYAYISSALKPIDRSKKQEIVVEIPKGSSISQIGEILEEKGAIKNGTVFSIYAKAKSKNLQAGTYLLHTSMNVDEVMEQMSSGNVHRPVAYKITIKEGTQVVEIADTIAKELKWNKDDVVRQLNDKSFVQKLQQKYPALLTNKIFDSNIKYPLEGYLYPATYSFYKKDTTLEEIVTAMLEKTNALIVKNEAKMKEKNFDVHQLLTLSSLIEEEATGFTDRQKIASVFYNRLTKGMPLQTDPTVLYALGKHKERVLYKDLKVNSPYNTYVVKGLPVGPIANSGKQSVQAALEPAQTDYYYFLAAPNGEVYYAKTLEEHNALKQKYITQK
ncbi:endolytic transglycosylase MltG [Bacillus cytotoxicus]|uniref:Endolytic murein transglycosylase n=1 Tax=Bacillus cytotoxicus (strain DSM 22905 / CIP 110041 / 391-98 / NVH 391-98) TaxID=315749 RepID=A7GT63_BACCN|nr:MULTISPECIES: endolytic transglycosylase MltG [Bacillus cereus group]ABS23321.1 aminodeoxychorismate lyase [Bacillus cytotoxicus NVH 391-98]AWC29924.1 endolytic transglycosylase MltG [Bacillus cytotoxicus]AWC42060.1 endolytic transglycosylase MltG [Bacillus cytotoxicus]AWC45948.1 endolytic transglycosylase MltG [Bacillus cytotoxicus]AWC49991.1 endolytic transglycosylase MltG [Bacillus cytotoxicus]